MGVWGVCDKRLLGVGTKDGCVWKGVQQTGKHTENKEDKV